MSYYYCQGCGRPRPGVRYSPPCGHCGWLDDNPLPAVKKDPPRRRTYTEWAHEYRRLPLLGPSGRLYSRSPRRMTLFGAWLHAKLYEPDRW